MGWFDHITGVALEKLSKSKVNEYVQIDKPNRRVFVSDFVVQKAVEAAGKRLKDAELVGFARAPGGYDCVLKTSRGTVQATVLVTGIEWVGDKVRVKLATPKPPQMPERPVVSFFARAISSLVGGTGIGESVFSAKLPEGAVWNGREATLTFDLARRVKLPGEITALAVLSVDVTEDANGLWFKVADGEKQFDLIVRAIFDALWGITSRKAL